MSNILPSTRNISHWFVRAMERDYLPGVEPYLAWLRQPVGWFVLATVASVLVGLTVAPLALSIAAGLMSLLMLGLAYPWLAVRLAKCELVSQRAQLMEDEAHEVQVHVRNRCPWPLWGLIIEGFVVSPTEDEQAIDQEQPSADIALSPVAWLSQASYRLAIEPRFRGRYPKRVPQLTCAFPFGLWTARRPIDNVTPLTVQPKQIKLAGLVEQSGRTSHHGGNGSRSGGHADFLGLRDYRVGDSIRHIHWAHTARLDSLVVCERSAAEQSPWQIVLNPACPSAAGLAERENLAWRVRIAASLCALLHQQSVAFTLTIADEETWSSVANRNYEGNRLQQALERLTDVPLDGSTGANARGVDGLVGNVACSVIIDTVSTGDSRFGHGAQTLVGLKLYRMASNWRQTVEPCDATIDLDQPIAMQINAWLQRVNHGRHAA